MICPKCHKEINDDSLFCGYCGSKLEKCPKCHKLILGEYMYCDYCGTALNNTSTQNTEYSNTNSSHQQYAGYYKPLEKEDTKEKPVFENKQKLNIKKILIAVLVLLMVTGASYYFIYYGPKLSTSTSTTTTTNVNTEITNNANLNMSSGKYALYNDEYYIVDNSNTLLCYDADFSIHNEVTSDVAGYVQIIDDKIYYCDSNYHFMKCNITGDKKETIIDAAVYYPHIEDNKIYYQLDSDNESLYVCDLDGKNAKKLNDHQTYNIIKNDHMIYYTGNTGVYAYDLDNDTETTLVEDQSSSLVYISNTLYFTRIIDDDNYTLCSYNLDTKEKVEMIENAYLLNATESNLYYLDISTRSVTSYSLSTKETSSLNIVSSNLTILDNKCITNMSDVVTVYNLDGTNAQVIINDTTTIQDDDDTQEDHQETDDNDTNYV